jgi:hypothetical protein
MTTYRSRNQYGDVTEELLEFKRGCDVKELPAYVVRADPAPYHR